MFDGKTRGQREVQLRVRLAKSGFHGRGLRRAREEKTEVTGAFGPGGNVVMQPGGNFEPGDAGYPARSFLSIEFLEDSAAGHGDHHYTGSGFFALSAATGHLQSVAQQEFLESDGFVVAGDTKA